ncbi:MAG: dihydroorotase family protein [Candidatus Limnocylindrales bacterium]|nr:dihydroorotase family protein [Candidatus Limnocylindrales bacterium]
MTDVAGAVDVTIRSRRIWTPDGWRDGAVVVADGKIVSVCDPGDEPPAARRVDATDRVVIPGLIDTHVHLRDPGFTDKEDFTTGTRAAAAGGVTTVLDMPNVNPPTSDVGRLRAHLANAKAKSIVDFGHNAAATIPENIAALAEAGATAFKVFMMSDVGRDYPHMPGIAVDDHATLFRICEEVAKTGLPLFVHPWDQSLYQLFVERAWARWGRDFRSYARAGREGEGIVLDSGIQTMLLLQRETRVRLHILHVMTIGGIEMIRRAKAAGQAVTAEANPHSLFVANSWANIEKWGPMALGMWVPDDHAAALRRATEDGLIDVIATDHAPHTREEKEIGWRDMYAAPGGSPMIQHYLSLLLSEVNAGRLGLERVIELCTSNPAKLVNLYPRKGAIAPGSDADLVVVDLSREAVISAATSYHKCGWTNLEGRAVTGLPVMTILRGQVIAEDGVVHAPPGTGQPVSRISELS